MPASVRADRVALASVAVIAAALAVLSYAVVSGSDGLPIALAATLAATALVSYRPLLEWHVLLGVLIVVILFIPIKRYGFPANLPISIEPYRVLVALIAVGWLASLLVDPSVRVRAGVLGPPLALVLFTAISSIAVNGPRVKALPGGEVVKGLSFLASFVLVYFLVVSVVRTREKLELLLKLLVTGGAVVSVAAIVESRTAFNPFDYFLQLVPVLEFQELAVADGNGAGLERAGTLRVLGSAQHPIALSAALAMLLPFGLYLALTARRPLRWWVATVLLGLGTLAAVSRTGVIMLVVVGLVFLWLRPRETRRRVAPLVVPALVVVFFALPNTLGSLYGGFFGGGLKTVLADQNEEVEHAELSSSGRIADIAPTLDEVGNQPLLGQGLSTRVAGVNARLLDDQWLLTLAETGILGFLAWIWLFKRAIGRLAAAARRDTSARGWLYVALAASIYSFAVGMVTYDAFSFIQVTFILFIVLALAAVALADRLSSVPVPVAA